MMPAANQGVGMNMGFPDVCTTPAAPAPIPIPYPNMGMNAMAMPFVPNVLVSMAPAHNMSAKPTLTNGDNAGVAHPLFMQPGGTTMGNPMILMGGMPAAHLCVPTYGNNFNNPVGAKIVPSVTNVLLSCAATLTPEASRGAAQLLHRERGVLSRSRDAVLRLRLPAISLRSDRWLAAALRARRSATLRGVALDLRGNPGGSTAAAVRIAELLLGTNVRIAVAVDRDTASAAELLAARLQDTGRARVFGAATYGKATAEWFCCTPHTVRGTGQRVRILRARGDCLGDVGVAPDEPCPPAHALRLAERWLRLAPADRT